MRKIIASAAAVALSAGLATASPAVARGGDHHHANDSQRLVKGVTVNGILQHLRAFQAIADRNDGNRASGLSGHLASLDYVAKRLKKAGYNVTKQPFTFAFSRDLAPATLSQTAPEAKDFETHSFDYSGSGDVTGTVVPIDLVLPPSAEPGSTSGCEAADFPAAPTDDAVALMQRGTCTFADKANNAAAAGYDAAIIFNEGQEGRQELLTGTLGEPVAIPVVGLSFADGQSLAQTGGAQVHVTTSTENDPNRTTYNLIADLPKKQARKVKHPDQVVVVGAHLDSVAVGPGINDNGSGSATILEIAEELAEAKPRALQRPVRFAFWGAEEAGLLGAEHYVANLTPEQLSTIYANLNFDMLGSTNYVRFVYDGNGSEGGQAGPAGSDAIESIFTDWFDRKNLASAATDFDGRSDYGPFIDAGIPAGGLFSGAEGVKTEEQAATYGGTAGAAYDACYHAECDDMSNISTKALHELGDAAAHATWVMLTAKQGLHPDGSIAPKKFSKKSAGLTPGSLHHSVR